MKAFAIALLLASSAFAAEAPVCFDSLGKVSDENLATEFNSALGVWAGRYSNTSDFTGIVALSVRYETGQFVGTSVTGDFKTSSEMVFKFCALRDRRFIKNTSGLFRYVLSGDVLRAGRGPLPDAETDPTEWQEVRRVKAISPGVVSNQ